MADRAWPIRFVTGMYAFKSRVDRLLAVALWCAATVALAVLVRHAWLAVRTPFAVDLVSGVWLTLARDLRDGVFYRAVAGSGEYGGTRYFPLFFMLIAAFMRAGIPPWLAGQLAGLCGAALMATGVFRLLRALDTHRSVATAAAMLTLSPFFVQESIFGIRVEPLAAGCALLGAAAVARHLTGAGGHLVAAAIWLVVAFAAKPVTVYAQVACVVVLALSRRRGDAAQFALLCVAFDVVLLAAIDAASQGRAFAAFRACALAGGRAWDLLSPIALWGGLPPLLSSKLLAATLGVAALVLLVRIRLLFSLPAVLLVTGLGAALVALETPGTIVANQGIEPWAAAVVLIAFASTVSPFDRGLGSTLLLALLAAAVVRGPAEIARLRAVESAQRGGVFDAIAAATGGCRDPLLSESPLVPVVAGRRAVLLDPFAFRVAALKLPGMQDDLVSRISRREFGCVLLDFDPASPRGHAWYERIDLGTPVAQAILASYQLRGVSSGYRVYVPRLANGSLAR